MAVPLPPLLLDRPIVLRSIKDLPRDPVLKLELKILPLERHVWRIRFLTSSLYTLFTIGFKSSLAYVMSPSFCRRQFMICYREQATTAGTACPTLCE